MKNPGNTELLVQKHRLLGDAVKETKEKLETMNIVDTQMYIDGYQVKLVSDTSYGSLWEVSFTLEDYYRLKNVRDSESVIGLFLP